jgi:hypothetical protein
VYPTRVPECSCVPSTVLSKASCRPEARGEREWCVQIAAAYLASGPAPIGSLQSRTGYRLRTIRVWEANALSQGGQQEHMHAVILPDQLIARGKFATVQLQLSFLDADGSRSSLALCRNTCRTGPTTEPKRRKRKEEKGAHICIYIVIFTT